MVRWIPGEGEEESALLAELGLSGVSELFRDVPPKARVKRLGLPAGREEQEVVELVDRQLSRNRPLSMYDNFLGGPLRDRYSPALVDGMLQRSEYYTSYTPYQPEASQGMLQVLFEFQSLWLELCDMEVANASLYDGATAVAEAMLMARRIHEGSRFLVPSILDWETRSILGNYIRGIQGELVDVPMDPVTGAWDLGFIERASRQDCFGILAPYPDHCGLLQEGVHRLRGAIGDLPLVVETDPLLLSVLDPPGRWGADIVVAEGQGFGIPLSYGGPLLGLMAVRRRDMRLMPGRVVGATTDHDGRPAYTLTLQTREQHIRRSRATSNICTNQSLMALAFTVYATLVGPRGLARLAEEEIRKAHEIQKRLAEVPGLRSPHFRAPFASDFILGTSLPAREFLSRLARRKILGGRPLADPRPGSASMPFEGLLVSAGYRVDSKAMDRYVRAAREILTERSGPEEGT